MKNRDSILQKQLFFHEKVRKFILFVQKIVAFTHFYTFIYFKTYPKGLQTCNNLPFKSKDEKKN